MITMQEQIIDIIPARVPQNSFSITELLARSIEKTKLRLRAGKYLHKEDPAGVQYIRDTIIKDAVVFDIGAHKAGYLYYFLQQLHHSGHIYAFEPQSVLYTYLTRLKHLFNWDNVTIESFAVSEKNGTASLCVPHNHGKASSPCATIIDSCMQFDFQYSEEVQTISIDDYCRKHAIIPDFLKVDVEGNELPVFKGAEKTLQKYKPRILFECEVRFVGHERLAETLQFLSGIGYNGYFISGKETHPIAGFDHRVHQDLAADSYCNNFIFE